MVSDGHTLQVIKDPEKKKVMGPILEKEVKLLKNQVPWDEMVCVCAAHERCVLVQCTVHKQTCTSRIQSLALVVSSAV